MPRCRTATWRADYDAGAHQLVDLLRSEHPGADIWVMPFGEAAIAMRELYDAGELPDVTQPIDTETGMFIDTRGLAAPILIELGSLVWLRAIYGVDLSTYEHDPGYLTDLKALANAIVDDWDPAYELPPDQEQP